MGIRLNEVGDFVTLRIVELRGGEFDAEVISGVWSEASQGQQGTIVTIKPKGRRVTAEELLQSPDVTSSASRQHWIDTGEYLTLGDRPELELCTKCKQVVVLTDRIGVGTENQPWHVNCHIERDNEDDFTNPNGA
jgi:hypothetical protein